MRGTPRTPEPGSCASTSPGRRPEAPSALANLKRICEEHLKGQYRIEVIDVLKNPQLARGDQILAIPTLVRKLPAPMKKIIGDLSNEERVLIGLDLRPLETGRHEPGPGAAVAGGRGRNLHAPVRRARASRDASGAVALRSEALRYRATAPPGRPSNVCEPYARSTCTADTSSR